MAESLKFVAEAEPWSVYRLEDGTIVKMRLVMTSCTPTDQRTPEGRTIYQNRFQVIQEVEFPDGREIGDAIKGAARRGGL